MMSHYRLRDLLLQADERHEGWLRQFDALVLSKPTEILIWEVCHFADLATSCD